MLKDFISYVKQFDLSFERKIRGATETEIQDLETLVGGTLPQIYKDYLKIMGRNDDQIFGGAEPRTEISEIIDFYQQNAKNHEIQVPENCIVIGVGGAAMDEIYLDLENGKVFEGSGTNEMNLWADSFEKLLFKRAYMRYGYRKFPFTEIYSSSKKESVLELAKSELMRLGYEILWFSDSISCCAENSDAMAIVNQFKARGVSLRVAAKSKEKLQDLLQSIEKAVKIQF